MTSMVSIMQINFTTILGNQIMSIISLLKLYINLMINFVDPF